MARVAALWRHPIKSHGRETLASVDLFEGQTMPWDRHWAVTHKGSKFDGMWAACHNFMIGTRNPELAAIWASLDEASGDVTLEHPKLGQITVNPDNPAEQTQLIAWLLPLVPAERAQPSAIVRADRGLTDTDFASVSIMNPSSHRAVSQKLGRELEPERWRGNIWLDGLGPWEEFEWIGRTLRIGTAELTVRDRIERCMHTTANPRTGQRDADTLGALEDGWGHRDFGVYAEVTKSGHVAIDDKAEVI